MEFLRRDPPHGSIVVPVNYDQNPFLPEDMRAELEYDRRDPETFAHVWLGEYNTRSDAQVFAGRYEVAEFEPAAGWAGPYFGADWGFAQDPDSVGQVLDRHGRARRGREGKRQGRLSRLLKNSTLDAVSGT